MRLRILALMMVLFGWTLHADQLFAQVDIIPEESPTNDEVPPEVGSDETYKVVEEMPRFPGCEDMGLDKSERNKCAQEKMLKFMYENLKYPKEARQDGIQGMTITQFVVGKSGKVEQIKCIKDIGGGCCKASTDVLEMMPIWIPGKQRGKPVAVLFTLPLMFEL